MKERHFSHCSNLTQKENSYPAPIHDQPKRSDSEVSYCRRISTQPSSYVTPCSSHCITQQLVLIRYYLNTKLQHIFQQRKWVFYSFNAQKYFSLCILWVFLSVSYKYLWISATFTFILIVCLQAIWWILGRFWNTLQTYFFSFNRATLLFYHTFT